MRTGSSACDDGLRSSAAGVDKGRSSVCPRSVDAGAGLLDGAALAGISRGGVAVEGALIVGTAVADGPGAGVDAGTGAGFGGSVGARMSTGVGRGIGGVAASTGASVCVVPSAAATSRCSERSCRPCGAAGTTGFGATGVGSGCVAAAGTGVAGASTRGAGAGIAAAGVAIGVATGVTGAGSAA